VVLFQECVNISDYDMINIVIPRSVDEPVEYHEAKLFLRSPVIVLLDSYILRANLKIEFMISGSVDEIGNLNKSLHKILKI
jgi:hypothetical protein